MADTRPAVAPEPVTAAAPSRAPRTPTARREPLWRDVLGDRLRSRRHERGETLDDTAARAGISPQYLSEMERGVKDPSSEMIAAVAGALGLTLVDLTLDVAATLRGERAQQVRATAGRATLMLAA